MKAWLSITLSGCLVATASAADEPRSVVRFSNNDSLPGSLHSLTTERLVWDSPVLDKPSPFLLEKVLDLSLDAEVPEVSARHEATVTLTNGDVVRGQLAGLPDGAVELDTSYAGRLRFNRLMVSDIRISERPDLLYRGPTGIEDWKLSGARPAWTYRNSSFRSSAAGSIARSMNLPDECSIAFDVEWRSALNLKLVFFSDDLATDRPTNGYELSIQKRFLYLRNCKTQMSIGNSSNAASLQQNEKARIEIRSSLRSGKTCVLVDDVIVEVWTDTEVATMKPGRGVHFISQNESPMRVSRIEIAGWDGHVDKLPEQPVPGFPRFGRVDPEEKKPGADEKKEAGRMELRNGDSITGEVISIEDGRILVKTPFRDVTLPLEALRVVNLKPAELERCKRESGDVRAWLPDGSSLVFRLDGVGEGTLSGSSQNFGTATFRTKAFSRIEFNIYEPDLEEVRLSNRW
ncbi:MAG: hypothetical protein EOP87_08675 [Verrucomicrobiaceae bacterium]|nr:MAG: hypothetical protein EOP87_08675 [Verrucomicrobiaceae bacterium]